MLAMFVWAVHRGFAWDQNNVPISAQNARDILQTLCENFTGKYAGYFAGIVTVVYLKVWENIHQFTDVFIAENIS